MRVTFMNDSAIEVHVLRPAAVAVQIMEHLFVIQ